MPNVRYRCRKESIEISHLEPRLFFSRALERVYTFDTPVSYEVNYWLLGYRPAWSHADVYVSTHVERASVYSRVRVSTCVCVTHAHSHTGVRPVPYRNSQFARAFTFEFPLFTFRIVVGTLGNRSDEEAIVSPKRLL